MNSIIDGVSNAIESLCSCDFLENSIDSAVFSCRNTNKAVVFKAHISIANKLMSANQILHLISRWVETSPSIVVVRTLLQVDPTCPTELEALLANDCQKPSNISVATPPDPDAEKRDNNSSGIIVPIIGTAVGLLVTLIIIMIIVIGCVVLHKAKIHESW